MFKNLKYVYKRNETVDILKLLTYVWFSENLRENGKEIK